MASPHTAQLNGVLPVAMAWLAGPLSRGISAGVFLDPFPDRGSEKAVPGPGQPVVSQQTNQSVLAVACVTLPAGLMEAGRDQAEP